MALAAAVLASAACGSPGEERARHSGPGHNEVQALPRQWASCLSAPAETVTAAVMAELLPSQWPGGEDGAPGRMTDVAADAQGRLYAVDAILKHVTQLSAGLRVERVWGNEGDGPGEFRNPVSVVVDDAAGEVVVIENNPDRIHRFDLSGALKGTHALANGSSSVALVRSNRLASAMPLFHELVQRAGAVPLVHMVDTLGRVTGSLRTVRLSEIGKAPFFESHASEVKVFAGSSGTVLVALPAANQLTVFDSSGSSIATAQGCVPHEAEEWARTGAQAGADGRAVQFLAAAFRGGDGRLYTLNRWPDDQGFFHVDSFDASGRPLKAYRFKGNGITIHSSARFMGSPSDILTWWTNGHIQHIRISGIL